jgi:ParB family chromosome partitioning protein
VPAIGERAYAALRDNIAARGILVPLELTSGGVVVDGHQRLRVARELGLKEVPVELISPAEDLVDFMVAAALQRRHLSPIQRATLVLELEIYGATRFRCAAEANEPA